MKNIIRHKNGMVVKRIQVSPYRYVTHHRITTPTINSQTQKYKWTKKQTTHENKEKNNWTNKTSTPALIDINDKNSLKPYRN